MRLVRTIEERIMAMLAPRRGRTMPPDRDDARTRTRRRRMVCAILSSRRDRTAFFPKADFGETEWDILLRLYEASLAGRAMPVSTLWADADMPAMTALRHLSAMAERGLLVRTADPSDGERIVVRMSAAAEAAMDRYLDTLWRQASCRRRAGRAFAMVCRAMHLG